MAIGTRRFFEIYHSTHLHFSSSFDFHKYSGKLPHSQRNAFDDRPDRRVFERWATKFSSEDEALQYCISNFIRVSDWLYKPFDEAKDRYLETKKFYSSFTINIKKDHEYITHIKRDKNISFQQIVEKTRSGGQPPLVQLYLQNRISIEFICMSDSAFGFSSEWKKSIDPIVSDTGLKVCKYKPFMSLFRK